VTHILFAVVGAAGDIFPTIAVAKQLERTNHRVTILAPRSAALYARATGLATATVGDGRESEMLGDTSVYTNRFDGFSSWRRAASRYLTPLLTDYVRTRDLIKQLGPELVVVHPLATFGSLAAEDLGIPWVSLHLYPQLVPRAGRRTARFGGAAAARIRMLETAHGLRPSTNPILDRGWSPLCNLSIHDPALVKRTELAETTFGEPCGFPYWDDLPIQQQDRDQLERAADSRRPLLVATLGSFIGQTQPRIWNELTATIGQRGWSALLIGVHAQVRPSLEKTAGIFCAGFIPMSLAAPHADVLLHHGGVGTTYAGLLAGKPAVAFPYSFDQQFNSRLLVQAGVGRAVEEPADLAVALDNLSVADRARDAARSLRSELTDPSLAAANVATRLLEHARR